MPELLPSKRQKVIYDCIANYIKENGISPKYKEIMDATNVKGYGQMFEILNILVEKGYITKVSSKKRGINLVIKKEDELRVAVNQFIVHQTALRQAHDVGDSKGVKDNAPLVTKALESLKVVASE